MKKINIVDRLTFLAEKFDVFEPDEDNTFDSKLKSLTDDGYNVKEVNSPNGEIIAIISSKVNNKDRILKKISISSSVFYNMVLSDPTDNKIYLQWMLNFISRLLKEETISNFELAIRFVDEDLPQAKKYLTLFEENKRKNKFKDLCKGSYNLLNVIDPTDINQYKSLSQLFDAVDPFIEKEPSSVERTLNKFVEIGQAEIPVRDRRYTLFIPKTTEANVIFEKFANWCTAVSNNGMFKNYTINNKKPNGKNSDIYIIINNDFFEGKSDELYQIHFETNQIKDRRNGQNVSIFENVMARSEGISNFFHKELLEMVRTSKGNLNNNRYLEYLIQFGFTDSLFELFDKETPAIKFTERRNIPKLPDISNFKNLDQLIICDANLVDIHPSIGKLENLEMLVLSGNNIKELPKEIGSLKNLIFLNLCGNPINNIPNEIKYLDKLNGGSLDRLAIKATDIGEDNYNKLKQLLPTTIID